jgi:hypothetical protein
MSLNDGPPSPEALLEALLQDADFEQLEELAQPFNVFEVLGAVQQEVRHSNFLAWLLNPSQNHGLGDYFLKRFLWKSTGVARDLGIQTLTPLEVDALDLTTIVARREWMNIDVMLISQHERFVCAIENKIFSSEHSNQLERYEQACLHEYPDYRLHLIYLNPSGTEPSSGQWVPIGYDVVRDLVEGCLKARGSSVGGEVQVFLRHYSDMLRRHIMRESTIEELCQRIYTKHQQALNLLFEYRPDRQLEITRFLEDLVNANPNWELDVGTREVVHFAPRSWEPSEQRVGAGWTKSRRVLLFEAYNRNGIKLHLYIGPGDQDYRRRVFDGACANNVFKPTQKMLGAKWNRIWSTEILTAEDYEQDMEWIQNRIRERMETFEEKQFPAIDGAIKAMALWH